MVPEQTLVPLKSGDAGGEIVCLVHPIEGSIKSLQAVANHLQEPVYGLQCSHNVPMTSVKEMAQYYVKVREYYFAIHQFWF